MSLTVLLFEPRVGPYKRDRVKTNLGNIKLIFLNKLDTAVHDKLDFPEYDNFYSLHIKLQKFP